MLNVLIQEMGAAVPGGRLLLQARGEQPEVRIISCNETGIRLDDLEYFADCWKARSELICEMIRESALMIGNGRNVLKTAKNELITV